MVNVHFGSASVEWFTPRRVLDRVELVDRIGLDPCWALGCLTNPVVSWDRDRDGLSSSWMGWGLVFVNPPYGRQIWRWVEKCAEADECIALLPARTDTQWFPWHADALAFWRGRLTFLGAPSPAPFPSVLAYWGERARRFERAFASVAQVAKRW